MKKHYVLILCIALSFTFLFSANGDLSLQINKNLNSKQSEVLTKVDELKEMLIQNKSKTVGTLVDSVVYFGNGEKNSWNYTYDENGNEVVSISTKKDETGTTTYSSYKSETTYSNEGYILEDVSSSWENGAWEYSSKEIYSYDDNGYYSDMLAQKWDSDSDVWIDTERMLITVDGFNFILIAEEWDFDSEQWVGIVRMTMIASTQIDINAIENWENIDSELFELWDEDSGDWTPFSRTNYTYDENGNLIEQFRQGWFPDTGEWIDLELDTFTYNENDQVLIYQYKAYSMWTMDWYLNVRGTNTYDASGNLVETVDEEWNYGTEAWENIGKFIQTFDSNNNRLTLTIQFWDDDNQVWEDSSREMFTYNGNDKVLTRLKQNKNWGATEWQDDTRETYEYATNGYLNHYTCELSQGDGNWVPWSSNDAVEIEVIDREVYYSTELFVYYNDALTETSIENSDIVADNFSISQNYPNPFNPTTVIQYSLPNMNFVKISVYNSIGQKVSTLVNKQQIAGSYSVNFDGSNLSSGIYFYQIIAGSFQHSKQMLLIK